MSTLAPPNRPPHLSEHDFSKGLKISVYLHVALAVFVIFKSLVFPGNPVRIVPTLRVDIVGLPDVLKKDLHRIPKAPPAEDLSEALKKAEHDAKQVKPVPLSPKETEMAKPDEMVLKPKNKAEKKSREKAMKNALDRIKALAKISAESETKSAPLVKGNKISRGTSLSADAMESDQASYYDLIRDRLQENWALPIWLSRQKFSAQVQLYLDSAGRIVSYKILKASGNVQFDDIVKRTLQQSQPFPVPPSDLTRSLSSDGILVGFPL